MASSPETTQRGTGIAGAADYQPAVQRAIPACYVCGTPMPSGSFAAIVLPPLAQACSAACANDPRFGRVRG